MRCSRGHGVLRAAWPQCQHVRGMPWSLCLTGGTSVFGALCFGTDQGVWCRWTVRVACLWMSGANSRMVGGVPPPSDGDGLLLLRAAVVGGLVLVRSGWGVLALEGLVRCVDIIGTWHHVPCLRSACAEVCLEDAARWPLPIGEERGVVRSALLRRLRLHGQNAPKTASLRHCEKIVLLGGA